MKELSDPIGLKKRKIFAHTHSLARYCAIKSGLYAEDETSALVIDQVIDWANEITLRIAPSIREKNIEKSSMLRKKFIKNELHTWFGYLENLFKSSSKDKIFFIQNFSIADITAWRVIHWFTSGQLDQMPLDFIKKYPVPHLEPTQNQLRKRPELYWAPCGMGPMCTNGN